MTWSCVSIMRHANLPPTVVHMGSVAKTKGRRGTRSWRANHRHSTDHGGLLCSGLGGSAHPSLGPGVPIASPRGALEPAGSTGVHSSGWGPSVGTETPKSLSRHLPGTKRGGKGRNRQKNKNKNGIEFILKKCAFGERERKGGRVPVRVPWHVLAPSRFKQRHQRESGTCAHTKAQTTAKRPRQDWRRNRSKDQGGCTAKDKSEFGWAHRSTFSESRAPSERKAPLHGVFEEWGADPRRPWSLRRASSRRASPQETRRWARGSGS